ncbi:MAG: membrane-bound lytic murein transglycosylase MltF [Pseudomonadota bacterium]
MAPPPHPPPTPRAFALLWRTLLALVAFWLLGTCVARPGVLTQARQLGVLIVATHNSPTAYYLGAHGPEGPEYELAMRFGEAVGVPVRFVLLPSVEAVMDAVATGRAHVGAAGLAITPEWRRKVEFSRPYQRVPLHVVYNETAPRPAELTALATRRVAVVAGTAHALALRSAAAHIPTLRYTEVPDLDTLDLLDRVWGGELDATVADRNELALTHSHHPQLRVAFDLEAMDELAWALPHGDPEIEARANAFFAWIEADTAALITRYYTPDERFDYAGARTLVRDAQDRLPALREDFERSANESGEDWRLLAAIGYQESRWLAEVVSATGVRGIMMLTADTAATYGVADRNDAAQSIRGGARFLAAIRQTVPSRIPEPDRTWLALASYNIGYGHVEDARVMAETAGKDPDSWQDVREYLQRLAQEPYYSRAKRGYARGWEAARFVDNVRSYLDVLNQIAPQATPPAKVAAPVRPNPHAPTHKRRRTS